MAKQDCQVGNCKGKKGGAGGFICYNVISPNSSSAWTIAECSTAKKKSITNNVPLSAGFYIFIGIGIRDFQGELKKGEKTKLTDILIVINLFENPHSKGV